MSPPQFCSTITGAPALSTDMPTTARDFRGPQAVRTLAAQTATDRRRIDLRIPSA
jgi:hypothetical protein